MRFEWDAEKNRTNQAKHDGLDFEAAARVFNDLNFILAKDRVVEGEQPWHAIGSVSGAILLVARTYFEDDKNGQEIIRIISAREADQRECRIYIQQAAE
jgi:hypothetical protein